MERPNDRPFRWKNYEHGVMSPDGDSGEAVAPPPHWPRYAPRQHGLHLWPGSNDLEPRLSGPQLLPDPCLDPQLLLDNSDLDMVYFGRNP